MNTLPNCPQCDSEYTYEDGSLFVCPMCAHEWTAAEATEATDATAVATIKDANGNVLQDGDDVVVIRDLAVKGSKTAIKLGMKVKNIKLIHDAADGHDIDCRIDGFGAMKLKSEFVKKA